MRTAARLRAEAGSPAVGISWRSKNPQFEAFKSVSLPDWAPVLTIAGAGFVNLQYGDTAAEIAEAQRATGATIRAIPGLDLFGDLDGVAALAAACDLVITTSSVTTHMAGALGRPVWQLCPATVGRAWYWFPRREDSPWYPSMRIFSQRSLGDWAVVLREVEADLRSSLA